MGTNKLTDFINRVEDLTKKPEKYLSLQENQAESIKLLTRDLYNFTKEKENPGLKTNDALEELVISNLDDEQIWQQIELQNNSVCNSLVSDVAHLLAKKNSLNFFLEEKKIEKSKSNEHNKRSKKKDITEIDDKKDKGIIKKQKGKSSVVDDKFFKLHEMENFLEQMEKNENVDNDENEIDYFDDDSGNDDENQLHYNDFFDQPEDEEYLEDCKKADLNDNSDGIQKSKRVKFNLNASEEKTVSDEDDMDEGSDDDNDNDDDDDDNINENNIDDELIENDLEEMEYDDENEEHEEENDNENEEHEEEENDDEDSDNSSINKKKSDHPSTFEARQERLKLRVKQLEEEALKEKPWQLKGEITASNRPQNSLLEEYVEFDTATRPPPVLTEKSNLKLEDVIIQRIKDKAWDDVVRKIKPVESDLEYKKKLVLDQEKSKLSLAQIYENEYLKQLENIGDGAIEKPEIEAPEHQEIRIMMNKLFSRLDALSNFHFTPKQVAPEVKIISNLPAISMEEVAPVATSEAALLAPEEIKPKSKGDLIGKSERSITDKKRERRQKKLKQKLKYKQLEAKAKLKAGKDSENPQNKVSQSFLQKITKSRNVIQLEQNEGSKYVKSSNAFFSKLQNETNSMIKKKNCDVKKKFKSGKKKLVNNALEF